MQTSISLPKLSQPFALCLALLTALGLMMLMYALWLERDAKGYALLSFAVNSDGTPNFYLIAGLLISCLSGLLVYQALLNRIQTRDLKRTTLQLKTLLQNLPATAYRVVVDTVSSKEKSVEFLSEACLELTGFTPEYIMQGHIAFADLIDKKDREYAVQCINEAVRNNTMYDFECRILTKNRQLRWVWHRGRVVEHIDAREAHIDGFVSDITSRKQAEIALVEARAYSQTLVDTAFEAIITINSKGNIKTFNGAAERMFGALFSGVRGKNISVLIPLLFRREPIDYINTSDNKSNNVGREMHAVKKDGHAFPIDLSIIEIKHQKDRTFVGLIRDLSQQRRAEDEARLHREQLAHVARLNALGEMASGIAHEINQPLAAISLFAQAGKRLLDSGQHERVSEVFDKLSQHAQRAGIIIERIQTMARPHDSEKKPTDCHHMLSDVTKLAEAEARIYDIEIDVSLEIKLPNVLVDRVQIQQVVLNLLRNGMQAMRAINCSNGRKISLSASQTESGDAKIEVSDSGCGVSRDDEIKLFEPFSTTKETGMGLGLPISRAIIEAHDGYINFYNNKKYGATFYFTLPDSKRET